MPKMTHPDASQPIEVTPAQVALYASQGWQVERPKSKSRPKPKK